MMMRRIRLGLPSYSLKASAAWSSG
jgi:hypothetical protein